MIDSNVVVAVCVASIYGSIAWLIFGLTWFLITFGVVFFLMLLVCALCEMARGEEKQT